MPASWADLIAAAATNLQTVNAGLKVTDFYRDSLPIGVEGLAEIGPASGQGQTNLERALINGVWVYPMTATLYLSTGAEDAAQARMLTYMSIGNALSVWNALDQLGAFAGIAQKVIVLRSHSYGNIVRGGGERLLTNSWDFTVWAAGD